MPKIFISYRHGDSWTSVGRLHDAVAAEFGRENIFFDVDAIPLGMDFREVLKDAIDRTDAMLVLVGPRWLTMPDHEGRRRLDNPHDFVRMEIEQALRTSIPVVPVLLDHASMPTAGELPETLRPLTMLHAAPIAPDSFEPDLQRLLRAIRGLVSKARAVEVPPAGERTAGAGWREKATSALASMLRARSAVNAPARLAMQPIGLGATEDAFISYSREDAPIMHRVRQHLAESRISVWTDEKLPTGAVSWRREIEQAIERSTCFIILLTPSAKNSEVVQKELGYARLHERMVIPLLAHGDKRTSVPLELVDAQYADITAHKFAIGMARLVDTVVAYREGRIPALPPNHGR
jgi:hypothetical protein